MIRHLTFILPLGTRESMAKRLILRGESFLGQALCPQQGMLRIMTIDIRLVLIALHSYNKFSHR